MYIVKIFLLFHGYILILTRAGNNCKLTFYPEEIEVENQNNKLYHPYLWLISIISKPYN